MCENHFNLKTYQTRNFYVIKMEDNDVISDIQLIAKAAESGKEFIHLLELLPSSRKEKQNIKQLVDLEVIYMYIILQ